MEIPTDNIMSVAQPMKAHVIDQSPNESIVMSYYLIPSINLYQLTDIMADCGWPIKSQIQAASLAARRFLM